VTTASELYHFTFFFEIIKWTVVHSGARKVQAIGTSNYLSKLATADTASSEERTDISALLSLS
jgi:hypothetical protein